MWEFSRIRGRTRQKSFCKRNEAGSLTIKKNRFYDSKYCKKEFESDDFAMENHWMPNVQYYKPRCPAWNASCDLQRQCSKDTDLNEYYSWNENSKLCGISNSTKNTPTFCKFPGSGFTTYSKKKECEGGEFHCQKVEGNSSICLIFSHWILTIFLCSGKDERCRTFFTFCYPELAKNETGSEVTSYSKCEEKCTEIEGKTCYLNWNAADKECLIEYDINVKCKPDRKTKADGTREDWKWELSIAHQDCGTGAIIFAIVLLVLLVAAIMYILYWCKNLEV